MQATPGHHYAGMASNRVSIEHATAMKRFFLLFFTWWNGQTIGTMVWTWLYGELVGEDEFGNRYYRRRGGKIDLSLGFERRWVIYKNYAEASMIPPAWHGWMHHTVRHTADRDELHPAALAEAASSQSHRHARGLSPIRLDARAGPSPEGNRGLQGLGSGAVNFLHPSASGRSDRMRQRSPRPMTEIRAQRRTGARSVAALSARFLPRRD